MSSPRDSSVRLRHAYQPELFGCDQPPQFPGQGLGQNAGGVRLGLGAGDPVRDGGRVGTQPTPLRPATALISLASSA